MPYKNNRNKVGLAIVFALLPGFAHSTELDVNALVIDSQKAAAAPVSADCYKDDERLPKMADFMAGLAGQTKPAPLKLKAETFAKLRPDVVAMLKGNYEVVKPDCSVMSTAGGFPVEKVELDFVDLSSRVQEAAGQGDDETLKYLRKSFRAAPIKAADAAPIFGVAQLSTDAVVHLSKMYGLRPVIGNDTLEKGCGVILLAQMYQVLGGKITDGHEVRVPYNGTIEMMGGNGGRCMIDTAAERRATANALGVTLKETN